MKEITEGHARAAIVNLPRKNVGLISGSTTGSGISEQSITTIARSYNTEESAQILRSLTEKQPPGLCVITEQCCITVITHYNDRVAEIMQLLIKRFDVRVVESIILACLGADDPLNLIKLLLENNQASRPIDNLLGAIFPIDPIWNLFEESFDFLL